MTGNIDALGDAAGDVATGAELAHAVDGGAQGHDHGSACLNCGTALIGAHCHSCGQAAHVHRTLASIGHDIAHGVFHFEGRIWRTLPMLLLHPGALTRRYVAGERVRFVSPLALFLFTVFLLFGTISAVGGAKFEDIADVTPATRQEKIRKLDTEIAKAQAELAKAEAKSPADPKDTQVLAARSVVESLRSARTYSATVDDPDEGEATSGGSWQALKHSAVHKFKTNPGLMLYKLQSSAYKYSWALIPLSTPFVALLFL